MTTVHDTATCRRLRSEARLIGVWIGAGLATILALAVGIWASGVQERSWESAYRQIQAQHQIALEVERRRVARYAEIDRLARQYDAMQGRD